MKKRLTAGLLCFALAICCIGTLSFADNEYIVSLRIEGISKTLVYEKSIKVEQGATVLELVKQTLTQKKITFTDEGGYISAIGDDKMGAFGGYDGWMYYINGEEPTVGMSEYIINDGDSILVCYADPYGDPPTLLPEVTAARDENGIVTLTFTANVTTYDADGTSTVDTVPVENIRVLVDGKGYVTDESGEVLLTESDSAKDEILLQISKTSEDEKPLVVRFAPDNILNLKNVKYTGMLFSDITPGAWYEEYVYRLVDMGAISGYPDGTFKPSKTITKAEYVKILAAASGDNITSAKHTFSDVSTSSWYAPYITWAVENEIIDSSADRFYPNNNITREEAALILLRFSDNVLKATLPQDMPAPAFTDNDQIDVNMSEAIYTLQKAGVLEGNGDGTFNPKGTVARSAASKMIVALFDAAEKE